MGMAFPGGLGGGEPIRRQHTKNVRTTNTAAQEQQPESTTTSQTGNLQGTNKTWFIQQLAGEIVDNFKKYYESCKDTVENWLEDMAESFDPEASKNRELLDNINKEYDDNQNQLNLDSVIQETITLSEDASVQLDQLVKNGESTGTTKDEILKSFNYIGTKLGLTQNGATKEINDFLLQNDVDFSSMTPFDARKLFAELVIEGLIYSEQDLEKREGLASKLKEKITSLSGNLTFTQQKALQDHINKIMEE